MTMKDVARVAGVDKGTVSRVLRGDPRISDATGRRVWDAARELGYRMDVTARGLSSGRTGLAGVLVPSLGEWWVGPFLEGARRSLGSAGWDLLPLESGRDPRGALRGAERLVARRVEGVLWAEGRTLPPEGFSLPTVRWGADEGACLGLDAPGVLRGVRRAFPGRRFRYCGGPGALFPFLSRLEEEGEGLPLALVDGAPTLPPGPSLWCGDARIAALLGLCCLPWGAFEIGVAAGRLLQRRLRHPEALFPKLRWLVHPRDSRGEPLPREGKRKP